MAGYPKSGNFMPKAVLRIFEPVAGAMRNIVGFSELQFSADVTDGNTIDPFGKWGLSAGHS